MNIAFTGTHGTGKTTLLNIIKEWKSFENYFINSNLTRDLVKLGFNINETGDDTTQCKLLQIVSERLLQYENMLGDRSILDLYVYTLWLYKHNHVTYSTFSTLYENLQFFIQKYDILFWIRPEFELIDDGVRSIDLTYQNEIDELFQDVINSNNHKINKIVLLSGSIEERLDTIREVLNKRIKLEE